MLATSPHHPVDRSLPGLIPCLDPILVLDACKEQLVREEASVRDAWREARMIEALYHPQRYLRVVYVLLSDPKTPANRHWPVGQLVYLQTPVREPMSRRGCVVTIGGEKAEAYRFPNDRRLRGLRTFTQREQCTQMWQQWLRDAGDASPLDIDTLQRLLIRYVPEQKWVVRLRAEFCDAATGQVKKRRIAVRSASPAASATLLSRHRSLAEASTGTAGFKVPGVIGADVEGGLLGVEWMRGEPLLQTLRDRDAEDVMRCVADGLHNLHRVSMPDLPLLSPAQISQRIRGACDDLASACPDLKGGVDALAGELVRGMETLQVPSPVTLHNDFHWNQLSIKRERFGLLDLERMAAGDPLLDAANFATQLEMLGHRPELPVDGETARCWRDSFLTQWTRTTGEPIDACRFFSYAALSRLELARGMMRHLRSGWVDLARRCTAMADDDLSRRQPGGSVLS